MRKIALAPNVGRRDPQEVGLLLLVFVLVLAWLLPQQPGALGPTKPHALRASSLVPIGRTLVVLESIGIWPLPSAVLGSTPTPDPRARVAPAPLFRKALAPTGLHKAARFEGFLLSYAKRELA